MNRVIIINLNGNAYQLEESGYDALRVYLDHAARRLEGNPDKDEIIADIEQAIADKFRAGLGAGKTVVITQEVAVVIAAMGPVEDASFAGETSDPSGQRAAESARDESASARGEAKAKDESGAVRRLYRIYEGAMVSGVCNGLAAYFNLDVTILRILFVVLMFTGGAGVLIYGLMVLIVPVASTPEEKASALGAAATAQEFIRRAKAGYYDGMRTFHDKHARREWKRKFKQDMRGWKQGFQYEMHRNAQQWQQHWTQPAQPFFGRPAFWLLRALLTVVAIFAIFSVHQTGRIFGLPLPSGVPHWIGIVAILVSWKAVARTLKAIQYGTYYPGGYRNQCGGPFGSLGGFLISVGFLAAVVWLADHFVPQVHEALQHLLPLLHRGIDSVQQWLDRP